MLKMHTVIGSHTVVGLGSILALTHDNPLLATVIGGCFTLVNTALLIWAKYSLGRKEEKNEEED